MVLFSIKYNGEKADQEGFARFDDSGADLPMGITTNLTSYTYNDPPFDQFVILEYSLYNDTLINNYELNYIERHILFFTGNILIPSIILV